LKENLKSIEEDIKRVQDTKKPFEAEKEKLRKEVNKFAQDTLAAKNEIASVISEESRLKSEWSKDIEEHNKLKDLEGPLQKLKVKYSQVLDDKKQTEKQRTEVEAKIKEYEDKAALAKNQIEQVLNESQDDVIADLKRLKEGYSRKFDQVQRRSTEKAQILEACRLDLQEAEVAFKEAEKEAMKFSNGKKPTVNLHGKEVEAMIEEARRKKAEFMETMKGQTIEDIEKQMAIKERQVKMLTEGISELTDQLRKLEEMVDRRRRLTIKLRSAMFRQVSRNFTTEMENCNLDAKMQIEYKNKSIEIYAKPRTSENGCLIVEPMSLSTLSGGERSKTLLCFIKGLWTFQYSPFRFMDEWNVYVDECARPALENMLVMHSLKNSFQCFLISPMKSDVKNFNEEEQECITFVKVGKK